MARRDAYLDALDARYRYARQLERIERDLADEQQRFQAAQSYASQARSELNQLDAQLSAVQSQEGLASELLKMVNRDTIAASRSVATARAARGAAQRTPTWAAALLDPAATGPGQVGVALDTIAREDTGARRMTEAQVDAVVADAVAAGATQAMVDDFRRRLPGGERPAVPSGEAKLTPEEQRDLELTQRAAAIVEFGGPAGIAGGFEGEAEVNRRAAAALPAGSLFATEDEAFRAYLGLLDDGRVTAEELAAQFPDATEKEVAQGLRVAQATYNRAKATKAFRNDERKFFNDRYLDQARKVAELEGRAATLQPQYEDISLERLRRQLIDRGIDPDDPYTQYRGTPMYGYARTADRLLEEVAGEELRAATTIQTSVARLLDQYQATGTDWTVADLERQLGKTLKGGELEKAVGFALALDRQRREGVDVPTQAQLQADQKAREAKAAEQKKRLATQEAARLERAKAEKERLGQEAAAEAMEAKTTEQRAEEARRAYSRARASGLTPEQARQAMRSMFAETAAPEPDIQLGGGVTVDAPPAPPAPAPRARASVPAPAPAPRPAPRVVTRREPERFPTGIASEQEAMDILAGRPAPTPAPAPAPTPAPAPAGVPDLEGMTREELLRLAEGAQ
jgi:hypothetical protein